MVDSQSSGDYSDVVSRRKFVSLAGATGAAAIAGCTSGDDEGNGDGNESGNGDENDDGNGETPSYPENVDRWFRATQTDFSADTYQWNLLQGWFIPHDQFGLFARWTQYLVGEDEFHPHLVQEWEHDSGEMTLTLSEDFTWGKTGDSITAEDLAFQLDIYEAADQPIWQFIDDVEATDEFELTVSYPEETNPDLVEYSLLGELAAYSPNDWEDTDWEENPAGVEITEPDPSGPLALTQHNDTYSQTEPRDGLDDYEDDHLADRYNWNGYQVEYRDGNNAAHQSLISDETDGQHSLFVPPNVLEEFPEEVHEFQIPGGFGMALWFDHSQEPWDQREVRQAFMYSIDRQSVISSVSESSKIHHPAPTGLTWASIEDWLGATEPDGFTVYERDLETAEDLLAEVDLEMGDIEVPVTYPQTWSDWAQGAQTCIDHLDDAGWNVSDEATNEGPGSYTSSNDWVVCADQHTLGGAPRMNHPYYSLDYILRNRLRDSESHFANYPETVELDGEEIDIESELQAIATSSDESEQEEIVERLARVVNEDVPCAVIMEKYEQSFINGNRFDIPDDSPHFQTYWPLWWLPQVDETLEGADTPGLMKAKEN